MHAGNREEIIAGIHSETPIIVMNAVIAGVRQGVRDEKYIEGLRKAAENEITLLHISIKDVAIAGLDVLGIEKYEGDDSRIKEYIAWGFKDSADS